MGECSVFHWYLKQQDCDQKARTLAVKSNVKVNIVCYANIKFTSLIGILVGLSGAKIILLCLRVYSRSNFPFLLFEKQFQATC